MGDDEELVDAVAKAIKAEINKFVAPAYSYIESEAASRIEKRTGEYPWDEDAGQLARESYAIIARVAIAAVNASRTSMGDDEAMIEAVAKAMYEASPEQTTKWGSRESPFQLELEEAWRRNVRNVIAAINASGTHRVIRTGEKT